MQSVMIHLNDEDRKEVEKIVTEKIKEALASDGLISDAMKMDERFTYLGKELYAIRIDMKKLREDLDGHFERDILRALERLKQETKS